MIALTVIDRRADYFAKPETRLRPDFVRQVLRGTALQEEMRRRWSRDPQPSNPDAYLERRA